MTTSTTSPRQAAFRTFAASDGTELFYRHWPALIPPEDGSERAVVMLHRGHEHSGRMAHIVQELGLGRFHFFAWDTRGHGQSPGRRGDAPDIETLVRDVEGFVRHIAAAHGIPQENMIVLAQSVGAVLAAAWAHDYAPPVRGLILGSPAFRIKLYVPFARQAIALRLKLCGNFFVNSYVKAGLLTHDQERAASFRADPLVSRAVSARLLTGCMPCPNASSRTPRPLPFPYSSLSRAVTLSSGTGRSTVFSRPSRIRSASVTSCRDSSTIRLASVTANRSSRPCAPSSTAFSLRRGNAARAACPLPSVPPCSGRTGWGRRLVLTDSWKRRSPSARPGDWASACCVACCRWRPRSRPA